jgi:hypothetical protein
MVTATQTSDVRPADKETAQGIEQPAKTEKQAGHHSTRPAKPDNQEKQAKNKARPAEARTIQGMSVKDNNI